MQCCVAHFQNFFIFISEVTADSTCLSVLTSRYYCVRRVLWHILIELLFCVKHRVCCRVTQYPRAVLSVAQRMHDTPSPSDPLLSMTQRVTPFRPVTRC